MDKSYDYVIVGAGSAGCVLANRLTEDKDVTVLLLEAGGKASGLFQHMPMAFTRYSGDPDFNWSYTSEPEPYADGRTIILPRGRFLGGSSSINGMLYVRGHPRDYDQWRQMGLEGWSYADVLPYFKKSEHSWRGESLYHGASGPLHVTQARHDGLLYEPLEAATRRAGYPVTDDPYGAQPEGLARVEMTVGGGRRASTAKTFLKEALGRPNLTVETRAHTSRVIIEKGRALGVEYRREGQNRRALAAREVLLSGGSYNSPQLLMLSGIGPADELRALGIAPVHDLPGVGRNLSEHPSVFVNFFIKRDSDRLFMENLRFDRATRWVLQWAMFGTGLFATGACAAVGFMRTRPELERPDVELIFSAARLDGRLWFPGVAPMQEPRADILVSLLHPDSRGSVTLRSANPADKPRIVLNLCKEQTDVDAMIRGIRAVRDIYSAEPMRSQVASEADPGADKVSDADLDAYVRRASRITHHPTGTCSMGIGPEAVVDEQLRVRGLAGLRVVDASAMPTVPGGNTNAPTIMVAEKAADMIRGRPRLPAAEV